MERSSDALRRDLTGKGVAHMQQHITERGPLHNGDGTLARPGYATSLLWDYDRSRVKAPKFRIKEWDYYLINDDRFAVALTLGDLGYMGLLSASVINLGQGSSITQTAMTPFPMGRFALPNRSDAGTSHFQNGRVLFDFEVAEGKRRLRVHFKNFHDGHDLAVDALLDEEPRDSMVIATPWEGHKHAFYYNQKIMAMRASGSFRWGTFVHGFAPDDSFGLLDWGRGAWTYDNTWYWACAQGWQDGYGGVGRKDYRFGMNLGYGFGDTSAASENMVFIDGVAHKLGRVDFGIPTLPDAEHARRTDKRYDLMAPWHVTDDEGRLDLTFTPKHDRIDYMNFGIIASDQHQVFGTFDGVVMIGGHPFRIANLKGSAEVIHNKY